MIVTIADLNDWEEYLSEGPKILGSIERLHEYISYIDGLSRQEKGRDFGIIGLIMAQIQGAKFDVTTMDLYESVTQISGEVNDRGFAHVMYLRMINNLYFYDGFDSSPENIRSILIDSAVEIYHRQQNLSSLDFGIEMVTAVGKNMLD